MNSKSGAPLAIENELSPWGSFRVRIRGGEIIEANPAFRRIFHFDGEGASLNCSIDSLFVFSFDKLFEDIREAVESRGYWKGRADARARTGSMIETDILFQSKPGDAEHLYGSLLEHPVYGDDIHYSTRSELNMLHMLMDNTPELVYIRDEKHRFLIANRAFREEAGCSLRESLSGRVVESFVESDSVERLRRIDKQVMATRTPVVNEIVKITFLDQPTRWWMITVSPVKTNSNQCVGTVTVARDVTDRKQQESELRAAMREAEIANRAKSEFLATVSHEIRTPINGIIGAAELCIEGSLKSEERSYVETILRCSNSLLGLVNDMLDLSKIEAGQMELERIAFTPISICEDVLEQFKPEAIKKGIELIFAVGEGVPNAILGDPFRFQQVISNLLSNAVKFTLSGEIALRMRLTSKSRFGITLLIEVEDSGIGIPKNRQEQIFNNFTQADMSTTRRFGGTGLGLSICRQLVSLMGGTLEVESTVGKGSRFFITLPCETSSEKEEPTEALEALVGLHVLIIEDNLTNREILTAYCQRWGMTVETCENAMQALSKFDGEPPNANHYQLILLDQQMPQINGLDLVAVLRSRKLFENVPIVLLSSSLDQKEAKTAKNLNIQKALSKPVRRQTLLEVIREVLDLKTPPPASDAPVETAIKETAEPLKILVAEDNPINQTIAQRRLEKLGHEVTLVDDGLKAVEAAADGYDVILMDVEMPGMDGLEATRSIRQEEISQKRKSAYIIAVTAHALNSDRDRCLAAGMNDYISKPFRAERFIEVLQRASAFRQRGESASANHDSAFADILDWYAGLSGEERDDIIEAARIFIDTVADEVTSMKTALNEHDLGRLRSIGHQIKSVGAIFHARRVQDAAAALERGADKNRQLDWPLVERAAYTLENELIRLERCLQPVASDKSSEESSD